MTLFLIRSLTSMLLLNTNLYGVAAQASVIRVEVEALFTKLEAGACQFNRNGTWYSDGKAKEHLKKKLTYLEDKQQINTTEEFILKGASESSVSGKAYLVKCGDKPAVESKLWLMEQLKTIRHTK